jgi:hypothetical protein
VDDVAPESVVVSLTGIEEPEKSAEPIAGQVFSSSRTELRKQRRAAARGGKRTERTKKKTARKSKKKNR